LVSTVEDVAQLTVSDPEKVAYVTQTTLSVDDTRDVIEALKQRFPSIAGPSLRDICYATQNRQTAVRDLAGVVELLLVVGAENSSNSNRLREIGEEMNVPSYLIADADSIQTPWLEGVTTVGITAGASAPEQLVQEVIDRLRELDEVEVEALEGVIEKVQFKLPEALLAEAS
jgi:4-hydroxy-3-methylbut-2-enyl diphosphate reductase